MTRIPRPFALGAVHGLVLTVILAAASGCSTAASTATAVPSATPTAPGEASPTPIRTPRTFILKSTAFANDGDIPVKYTCSGDSVSPPLEWEGAPSDAVALVLIMEDYSASITHWVAYLPASPSGSLAEDAYRSSSVLKEVVGYRPPCPVGHRNMYHFTMYALSVPPPANAGTQFEVEQAMIGQDTATASLQGWFQIDGN